MLRFISWRIIKYDQFYPRYLLHPKLQSKRLDYRTWKTICSSWHSMPKPVFCLQETKMQEGQLDLLFEGYLHR